MLDGGISDTNPSGTDGRIASWGTASAARHRHTVLTAVDIASRLNRCERTARRYLEVWAGLQHDARVPRVARVRTGRRGQPPYVAEPESFQRWLVGASTASP
mgnify:FL=1